MTATSNLLAARSSIHLTLRASAPQLMAGRVSAPPATAGDESLRVLGLLAEGPPAPGDALFAREVRLTPGRGPGTRDREVFERRLM